MGITIVFQIVCLVNAELYPTFIRWAHKAGWGGGGGGRVAPEIAVHQPGSMRTDTSKTIPQGSPVWTLRQGLGIKERVNTRL